MRNVACELARAMDRDRLRLVAGLIYDLHLARLHNEEAHVLVAYRKKLLPVPEQLRLGIGAACQLSDLILIKGWECDRQKVVLVHSCPYLKRIAQNQLHGARCVSLSGNAGERSL